MANPEKEESGIEAVGRDLFTFAFDREDIKMLVARFPKDSTIPPNKVEYELQILKIVTVGWCISYYLQKSSYKTPLGELYWQAVHDASREISSSAGIMVGHDIDYFQILREHLDNYVGAMGLNPDAVDPVAVMGPEFARCCGDAHDAYTILTGSKMFHATIANVKQYFESLNLI